MRADKADYHRVQAIPGSDSLEGAEQISQGTPPGTED